MAQFGAILLELFWAVTLSQISFAYLGASKLRAAQAGIPGFQDINNPHWAKLLYCLALAAGLLLFAAEALPRWKKATQQIRDYLTGTGGQDIWDRYEWLFEKLSVILWPLSVGIIIPLFGFLVFEQSAVNGYHLFLTALTLFVVLFLVGLDRGQRGAGQSSS